MENWQNRMTTKTYFVKVILVTPSLNLYEIKSPSGVGDSDVIFK